MSMRGDAREGRLADGPIAHHRLPIKDHSKERPPNSSVHAQRRQRRCLAMRAPAFCMGSSVVMPTPCRERQLPWDDTRPRGLPPKPTLQLKLLQVEQKTVMSWCVPFKLWPPSWILNSTKTT